MGANMRLGTAYVEIKGEDKHLKTDLSKAESKVKSAAKNMEAALKKAFMVGFGAAAAGAGLAVIAMKKVSSAAMVQEKAVMTLNAALKASDAYTKAFSDDLNAFASSMQKVTTYGDEEVLQLMALQKNLGVSADRLKDATKMTIGLAAATGRDVRSMAQYVAMAMQGEFTMLRRYIPALRATTDKTEQLRIVTEFAAKGFQVAQEETKTFTGRLKQFANLWGDLKERVGDAIIKNKAIIKLLEDGKKTLISWIDYVEKWVKANGDLIAQKTEEAIDKIKKGLKDALPILKTTAKAFVPIAKVIIRLFEAYANLGKGIGETAAKIVLHFEKTKGATVDEANAMFSLEKETEHLNKELKALIEDSIEGIAFYIDAEKARQKAIKATEKAEHDLGIAVSEAIEKMTGLPTEEWYDLGAIQREMVDEVKDINAAYERFRSASEKAANANTYYLDSLVDSNVTAEKGIKATEKAERDLAIAVWEATEKSKSALDGLGEKNKTLSENLKAATAGWASSFSSQLNDLLWDSDRTFKGILKSFMQMTTQMLIQAYVVKPFLIALGIPLAKGGVLEKGSLMAFAKGAVKPYDTGGVVTHPTIFPMQNGYGLMGEAGPEAIMPLARTPQGDLGVKATSSNDSGNVYIIMNNPTFQDQATLRRVYAEMATQIAERVAPGAVVRSYHNDGRIRSIIRGRA